MEIASKIRDFENKVYLDKISMSIRDLISTTDIPLFCTADGVFECIIKQL